MTLTRDDLMVAYGEAHVLQAEREIAESLGPVQKRRRGYEFFGRNADAALPLLNLAGVPQKKSMNFEGDAGNVDAYPFRELARSGPRRIVRGTTKPRKTVTLFRFKYRLSANVMMRAQTKELMTVDEAAVRFGEGNYEVLKHTKVAREV